MRDERLDTAKGLAIILVVYGHVVRGLFGAGIVTTASVWGLFSERFAYFVHLPLFAFATGLFVGRAVERAGAKDYLLRREWALFWPFLVWTAIMGVFSVFTSRLKNSPTTWWDVITIWEPLGHLWYLPFLMIATVVVVAARPWERNLRGVVGLLVLAVLSMLVWGVDDGTVLLNGMGLLVFMGLGAAIGPQRLISTWNALGMPWLLALAGALLAGAVCLGFFTPAVLPTTAPLHPASWFDLALGMATSFIGTAGLLCLCGVVSGNAGKALAFLGRQSMVVYLAHILCTAGIRIVLLTAGVSAVEVHVIAGLLFGVAAPLVLVPLLRWAPWLIAPPSFTSQPR